MRRRRTKKVARRATFGNKRPVKRALKERTELSVRAYSAGINARRVPDVARLATFFTPLCGRGIFKQLLTTTALLFLFSTLAVAQQLPRDEWGAPAVTITHEGGKRNV